MGSLSGHFQSLCLFQLPEEPCVVAIITKGVFLVKHNSRVPTQVGLENARKEPTRTRIRDLAIPMLSVYH